MIEFVTDPAFYLPASSLLLVLLGLLGRGVHLLVRAAWARQIFALIEDRARDAARAALLEWRLAAEQARTDGVVTPEEFTEICRRAVAGFWAGISPRRVTQAGSVLGTAPDQARASIEIRVRDELQRGLVVEPSSGQSIPKHRELAANRRL